MASKPSHYHIFKLEHKCLRIFSPVVPRPVSVPWPPLYGASRSHSDTPHWVGLLWTSDQPVAETSTWQYTTPAGERHPCLRRDLNSQSQQAFGRRSTSLDHAATVIGKGPGIVKLNVLFYCTKCSIEGNLTAAGTNKADGLLCTSRFAAPTRQVAGKARCPLCGVSLRSDRSRGTNKPCMCAVFRTTNNIHPKHRLA